MPHASPYRLHDLFFKESCASSHILAALIGAGLGTAIVTVTLWSKLVATQVLRYADTNLPLVDTPDAYFFLYRAQEMLAHGLEWSSVSALSTLLALLHKLTWLPLEVSAFWLPVVLSVACGLCYALWGRLLGLSAPLSGLAALAGTISPAFASRVHAGNLDTDGLIFFLLPLCLHTLARLSLPEEDTPSAGLAQETRADSGLAAFLRSPAGRRIRLWGRLVLCGAFLGWLWFPALLILPCGLWMWALAWPWSQGERERRLRRALALAVPLVGIPFLLVTPDVLPAGVQALREHVLESMGFLANPRADVIYQSIAELQNMTPAAWLTGLGGNVAGGLLMVVAFVLLVWRSPRRCLFLLPLLLLQAAAYASNRFLFFGVLPMALGVAALPQTLPVLLQGLATRCPLSIAWGGRSLSLPRAGNVGCVLALCAACALLSLEGGQQAGVVASTSLGRAEDQIGLALSRVIRAHRDKGETVALMHWWDEGYYLRYRTGVPSFFDGGSQAPLPAFIAARGFAIDHAGLARLWMRYFALHGGKGHTGWDPLVAAWGDEQTALNALSALFLLPEDKRDEQLKTWPALRVGGKDTPVRTLTTSEDKKAWLFPEGHVFIFLPLRFLSISPWWMAMGDRLHSDMSLVRNHAEILPRSAVTYDAGAGRLGLPQAMLDKGYKSGTVIAPTPEKPFGFPWGADKAEPLVILPAPSPFCFITNRLLARTTAFRLLAPSCENMPGFVPVAVNFASAGAWEVLE